LPETPALACSRPLYLELAAHVSFK
jgi:hypothetical protein